MRRSAACWKRKLICALTLAASCFLGALVAVGAEMPSAYPAFTISYWGGPPISEVYGHPAETTLARYQQIADAGFNLALTPITPPTGPTLADNIADNMKILDLCQAVGIKAIVNDIRILNYQGTEPEFGPNLDAIVATYSQHPALAGYLIRDEPTADLFPQVAAITQGLLQRDPARMPYTNLLPGSGASYEQYVRSYIETVRPAQVQWDHYPLLIGGEETNYYENLEIGSRLSREAGLPFQQTILAIPHHGYRNPSAADLGWEVYTSLSYGAKGIMYFTYWTQASYGEYHDGIIGEDGQPTEKYAIVKELNRRMNVLAPTLTKLEGLRVAHTDPVPQGAYGFDENFTPVVNAGGGPMDIGWLRDDENRDYLFVVNRSLTGEDETSFEVFLRDKPRRLVEISQVTGKPIKVLYDSTTQRLTVPLNAGEGRLFRIDTKVSAVLPGNSILISKLDYSETYTLGTAARPDASHGSAGNVDAYYNVEASYHGLPAQQWKRTNAFSFQKGGINTYLYASSQNENNEGASAGLAQSGGGTWTIPNAAGRDHVVVQTDAVMTAGAAVQISSLASDYDNPFGNYSWSTGGLTVDFAWGGSISLITGYNPVEPGNPIWTDTGLTTGIASDDLTWHNFAVEFTKPDNSLAIYVDELLLGFIDLTTFAGGIYQNYSMDVLGIGSRGLGWLDNTQIGTPTQFGTPVPEPSTVILMLTGLVGSLIRTWQKRK